MNINERKITVRELVENFREDDTTSRVTAWGGKLDVRPEYQREFVYDDDKRDKVINTVLNWFPLNIMYFVERGDGTFEVLDGQQRIISLGRFAQNKFSVKIPAATGGYNPVNFPNLPEGDSTGGKPERYTKAAFLDYELTVYVCEGTDKEKLDWFEVINIAGETLSRQEIRNALYHGAWLTDAKSAFSRRNCPANKNYGKYMAGEYIRQKFLETAFLWAADAEGITGNDAVVLYMQKHRADKNADELWKYFENVFAWVQKNFGRAIDPTMKGVAWGILYNEHKDDNLDPDYLGRRMKELLADKKEVTKRSGIYQYLLEGETKTAERYLSLRKFDADDAQAKYHEQGGKCALCGKPFELKEMHADHITPWSRGGKTVYENLQMLCARCNLAKSDK